MTRFLPFLFAFLVALPVHAADDPLVIEMRKAQENAGDAQPAGDSEDEGADDAAASDADKSSNSATAAPDAKPKVDWVSVESTGILSGSKSGALEKTLWAKQKRSEIEEGIQNLPTRQPLRSALSLQRRLLLSKTDTSLMIDDIGPLRGRDMLIQRINKLMDMGLYDDAWTLYTQRAENPYDVSIAQLGMLLLVMKNDLATACLEEKVFSAKFPQDRFFDVLDRACSQTLGAATPPKFPDDAVLQAVYNEPTYGVSAANPQALMRMTSLERALVLANGKIRYDGLTPQILAKTPSLLVTLYLMDRNLPESAQTMIKAETDMRGLSRYVSAVARDPLLKRAKDLAKDPEDQWPVLESALKEKTNPADLAPFADMLAASEPKELSTEIVTKVLAALFASQEPLSDFWLKAAQSDAAGKPIIYIYLQLFASLTPAGHSGATDDEFYRALKALKTDDAQQIIEILTQLNPKADILDSKENVYEKHSALTSPDNYVMPSSDLEDAKNQKPEQKQLGITVLSVLNSLADGSDNMYSENVRKALESLLNVGMIEDARLIGSETAAGILSKY